MNNSHDIDSGFAQGISREEYEEQSANIEAGLNADGTEIGDDCDAVQQISNSIIACCSIHLKLRYWCCCTDTYITTIIIIDI